MLIISPQARVSCLADIEDSSRGTRIVVEDGVVIDSFVKIKPAGGVGDVLIGAGSVINSGCVFYTGNGIRMGRDVLVAANCTWLILDFGVARWHGSHDRETRLVW
jgi:acetyltransferase-like isoleucine patch superfamily enzyme